MKIYKFLGFVAAIATLCYPVSSLGQAIAKSYQTVSRDIAANSAVDVKVYPGRASAIDFSQTDEVVTYVLIADPSRLVFSADAELASGRAKTIFLRPIQPLRFPGATTTKITSLSIKTVDSKRKQRLYTFNVIPANRQTDDLGIRIATLIPGQEPTLDIGALRTITASDVEKGLQIAISLRYTQATDPIVYKVRQFLIKMKTDNLSMTDAAASVGVDLSVIIELGKIGQEDSDVLLIPILIEASQGVKERDSQ